MGKKDDRRRNSVGEVEKETVRGRRRSEKKDYGE
jgi:hypothetical protein